LRCRVSTAGKKKRCSENDYPIHEWVSLTISDSRWA
jgi:hypothetical protein